MSVFVFDTPSPLKRVARNCRKLFMLVRHSRIVIYEPLNSLIWAGINDGFFRIRWTFSDSMDFTVYSIRCVYRAEMILGR